jgi:hypothetical protein
MKTRLVLKPGRRGTRKELAEYGKRLVYVRYRYDARLKRRWKTVELIIREAFWEPKPPLPEKIVRVRTRQSEADLHREIRAAGGRWDGKGRVWRMTYKTAVRLGLEKRIVGRESI